MPYKGLQLYLITKSRLLQNLLPRLLTCAAISRRIFIFTSQMFKNYLTFPDFNNKYIYICLIKSKLRMNILSLVSIKIGEDLQNIFR